MLLRSLLSYNCFWGCRQYILLWFFLRLSFCLLGSCFSIMYLNVDLFLFMLLGTKIHVWHNYWKFSSHYFFEHCCFFVSSVLPFCNSYEICVRPSSYSSCLLISHLYFPSVCLCAAFYVIFSDQYSSSIILSSSMFNLSISVFNFKGYVLMPISSFCFFFKFAGCFC